MWRCTCAVALLCAALVDSEAFKRAETSASPFVLISRYGRSSPRMMSSRIDKFFLVHRYGKRFDPMTRVYDITENYQNERERDRDRGREEERDMLQKWRPRCDCASYIKILALKNFDKRTPETMDPTVYQD